jgi:hypothetical protein
VKRKLIHILGFSLSTKAQGNRGSVCLLALVLAGAVPSFANTLTVTNTNDSGSGSLRDAIAAANAGDTIEFSVTGTIMLTSGSLALDNNLTITGPGAAQLAISGSRESPVFVVNSAVIVISGVTIESGGANTFPYRGAGIFNHGTLRMTNCIVSGNENVTGLGAGIFNDGTLTLANSTVSDNTDYFDDGAGIFNDGTLTLVNSTVSGNSTSDGSGGGIYNGSMLTLVNSTVSGNLAFRGGGISNSGTVTLTNSTIVGNSTTYGSGGGIYNAGAFAVKSTLFANNTPSGPNFYGNCDFAGGTVTSLGYNVSDDDTCASVYTVTGDENNVTPGAGLDPKGLQNNGGPTQTIALLPGSPAVDHIPVADCTDSHDKRITTDQRDVKRPQGPACDTGAFELVQTVPLSNFTALLAIQTGQRSSFELTARFTLGAGSDGIAPLAQPVTLQIANYTVEIPAGSFHQLWNSPSAPYIYEGTINGTKLVVGVIPLGRKNYEFNAVGSPVAWANVTNPVTVSLTVGNDGGSAPVRAFIGNH